MKNFGLASVIAGGLVAAMLGFAAPAQAVTLAEAPTAVIDHGQLSERSRHQHDRLDDAQPDVIVPHVDTRVRHSP